MLLTKIKIQDAFGESIFVRPTSRTKAVGQSAFGQRAFGQIAFGQRAFGQRAFGQRAFRHSDKRRRST
jgi:hypothetical protein